VEPPSKRVKAETPIPIDVLPEVKEARKQLAVNVEQCIDMDHVITGFELRKWRSVVGKAATFAEVAQQLLKLREGMVDECLPSGWKIDGEEYKQWSRAALASDLSLDALQTLMEQLMEAYNLQLEANKSQPIASPSASASGASSSSAAATDVQSRRKRSRCEEEAASSASGAPTLKSKVMRIRKELELEEDLYPSIAAVIRQANLEFELVPPEGTGLPAQADKILLLM